jgi:hypothetical protein
MEGTVIYKEYEVPYGDWTLGSPGSSGKTWCGGAQTRAATN